MSLKLSFEKVSDQLNHVSALVRAIVAIEYGRSPSDEARSRQKTEAR